LNEIGNCRLSLGAPVVLDSYDHNKSTGSFILIDRVNNNTVGAGMIVQKAQDVVVAEHNYSDFEIELNALVRKHFPHWQAKTIF
jgi:sulfate adenylyltransferase subunit 1